jgi:putative sigma-54 modulation protein
MDSQNPKPSRLPDSRHCDPAEMIRVCGIHMDITPALRTAVLEKGARLLRHQMRVVRIRIDLERDHTKGDHAGFVAKGRVEISGPDLIASVTSEDAYKSLGLLIDKLDRMLRERTRRRADRRNNRPAGTEFRDRLAPVNAVPEPAAVTATGQERLQHAKRRWWPARDVAPRTPSP